MAMTNHGTQERTTITLPHAHMQALKTIADRNFGGNVSATVRELIATHDVTKSLVSSSLKATAGA